MTLKEKKSKRKALAIRALVNSGEYSPSFALVEAERLNDEGLLLDVDYEPLADWLEELINVPDEDYDEQVHEEEETE